MLLAFGAASCSRNNAASEVGVDLAAMHTSVTPGDDFYGYANGACLRTTEIPAQRSSIGSFYRAFLETAPQTTAVATTRLQVRDMVERRDLAEPDTIVHPDATFRSPMAFKPYQSAGGGDADPAHGDDRVRGFRRSPPIRL